MKPPQRGPFGAFPAGEPLKTAALFPTESGIFMKNPAF